MPHDPDGTEYIAALKRGQKEVRPGEWESVCDMEGKVKMRKAGRSAYTCWLKLKGRKLFGGECNITIPQGATVSGTPGQAVSLHSGQKRLLTIEAFSDIENAYWLHTLKQATAPDGLLPGEIDASSDHKGGEAAAADDEVAAAEKALPAWKWLCCVLRGRGRRLAGVGSAAKLSSGANQQKARATDGVVKVIQ